MESMDKEFGTAMGALFHQIITDLKVGAPLWEDFLSKASKLHTALKSTLSVISAYLDAFQKIADSATNAKGATKDIGTVLTRICLRHKAVEARLKTFTSALMECLVLPLHDKLEEWKKMVVNLDKDHAKEYKKVRADIKKRTAEAQRWQKKARKIRAGMMSSGHSSGGVNSIGSVGVGGGGGTTTGVTSVNEQRALSAANQELLRAADAAQTDLNSRLATLQETEKTALKTALVEERSRYCLFVACLKPVMSEEMAMCAELSHLEEIITQLDKHTQDPFSLPSSTEQMIAELKGAAEHGSHWALQTPPSSPSSLGSRKSSMCSLGSIHSSSSGSVASHSQGGPFMQSPSHSVQQQQQQMMMMQQQAHIRHRSLSQVAGGGGGVAGGGPSNGGIRLSSVSSQDSGFTSQDTLVLRPNHSPPPSSAQEVALASSTSGSSGECSSGSSGGGSNSSTPCTPYPPGMGSTWPNLQETGQFDRGAVGHHHHHMMNHNSGVAMVMNERPHTISTAYEKGHQRPALSVYTFQPLEHGGGGGAGSSSGSLDRTNNCVTPTSEMTEYETLRRCRDMGKAGPAAHLRNNHAEVGSQESLGLNRPPLPQRCSSLERPVVPPPAPSSSAKSKSHNNNKHNKKEAAANANAAAADPAAALPDFHMAAPDMIVPQPVYMNASELRCQQQQLGLNGDDAASSAIYSSLASCTIYDDGQACSCHGHPDSWRMPPPRPVLLKRPASFSGGYADPGSGDWSSGGMQRSAAGRMSNMKRTSIPSFATLHEVSNVDETGHPIYNDEITPLAEGPPSHLSANHTPPPPPAPTDEVDLAALPPPPDFLLDDQPNPKMIPERSLSVADAVKTLNEIRHQPASPGVVRRAQSMRTTSDSPDNPRTLLIQRQQLPLPAGSGTGNKIGPGTAPKTNRGHHHSTLHHSSSMKNSTAKMTATQQLMMSRTLPKQMPSHPSDSDSSGQQQQANKLVSGLLSKSSFVQQLNAKLAQQHQSHHQNPNNPNSDPSSNQQQQRLLRQPADHESLMDQIRRGTSLRRARSTSDRSSPHFRH